MKKKVKGSSLSFIFSVLSYISFTLLLLLCFKQGYASYQREDEDIIQPQRILKVTKSKPEEQEACYGDFDMLSEDTLFHHILPHCDYNIINVNRSFFTLVTGYSSEHIFDQGFERRPTKPVCCIISHAVLNFENHLRNIEQVPNFVWYSLVRKVEGKRLNDEGVRDLGQALKETPIHTLNLSLNNISQNM